MEVTRSRPSTPLGNALGSAMITSARFFDYALPLAAIRGYRLIPANARGRIFGGPPASGQAMRQLQERGSSGWDIIRQVAMSNHPPRPRLPRVRDTVMPSITAPGYSTVAGAITGLALWALQRYAFRGAIPEEVQWACWTIIPAAVTGVAALLTKRFTVKSSTAKASRAA
jgi:hypothetical protein